MLITHLFPQREQQKCDTHCEIRTVGGGRWGWGGGGVRVSTHVCVRVMFGAAYPKIPQSRESEDESRRRKRVVADAERVVKLQL